MLSFLREIQVNPYISNLFSATQAMIDRRANKISALEMYYQGYRALGRHNDKRLVGKELEVLRLEQIVQKRGLGLVVEMGQYIRYLENSYV